MLDIRYPIGLMFVILGAILAVFGRISDPKIYQMHSLGLNVNFSWGCLMLAFGLFMLLLAIRAQRRKRTADKSP